MVPTQLLLGHVKASSRMNSQQLFLAALLEKSLRQLFLEMSSQLTSDNKKEMQSSYLMALTRILRSHVQVNMEVNPATSLHQDQGVAHLEVVHLQVEGNLEVEVHQPEVVDHQLEVEAHLLEVVDHQLVAVGLQPVEVLVEQVVAHLAAAQAVVQQALAMWEK
jgi:hypothetical protein